MEWRVQLVNYLEFFPALFLDDLVRGHCVPFVGAGLSRNAELPAGRKMPDWDGLGRLLAAAMPGYEYAGALDAISAYAHEYSRASLIGKISDALLVKESRPGAPHAAFCRIPFEIVCTTNFEFLLERSYANIDRYCYPVVDEDQLSVFGLTPSTITLLKLHGDLNHPSRMIATEDDYDSFLSRYPLLSTYLANLLISRTAFFVGYSLDDPDFRSVWQVIGDRLGRLRRQAYSLGVSASPQAVARFERRGVRVINLPGESRDYARILTDVFTQLREYWLSNVVKVSTVTREDVLAELSLPRTSRNRLCIFLIPSRLLSLYKSYVFPLAEAHGLTPITAEEVLSPGESVFAKIAALIERAEVIVADITSDNVVRELIFARNNREGEPQGLLVVAEEGADVPGSLHEMHVLRRPKEFSSDLEPFLGQISQFFSQFAFSSADSLVSQPRLLFDQHFYAQSLIASFMLLESKIREKVSKEEPLRPVRQTSLIQLLHGLNLIQGREYSDLQIAYRRRNELIHTGQPLPSREEAMKVIETVESILPRLK